MWITSFPDNALTPTAIALGNFDGVHRGHRVVMEPVLRSSLHKTLVTFNPHPREFFSGERRQLLTPLPEKVRLLQDLGFEQLILLPFDRELSVLSPQAFVKEILIQQLQAKQISVGADFLFGQNRSGTATDLKLIARDHGILVHITALHCHQNERISSSAIRQALQAGDLEQVSLLLGRPYELVGQVVKGQQLGRTLGFPTANLHVPDDKLLPRFGVYAVRVDRLDAAGYPISTALSGVMNLGVRPTVDGLTQAIEVHLLDWSGDLYGQTLQVNLEKFLRPEQRFGSLDDLKAQIQLDCEAARQLFAIPKLAVSCDRLL